MNDTDLTELDWAGCGYILKWTNVVHPYAAFTWALQLTKASWSIFKKHQFMIVERLNQLVPPALSAHTCENTGRELLQLLIHSLWSTANLTVHHFHLRQTHWVFLVWHMNTSHKSLKVTVEKTRNKCNWYYSVWRSCSTCQSVFLFVLW